MRSLVREVKNISIIDIDGQIKGPDSKEFLTAVNSLLQQGKKTIVLNFARVSFIDSGAIGALMAIRKSALDQGARIAVMALSDDQRDLFEMTNINSMFSIYSAEREMLDGLSA